MIILIILLIVGTGYLLRIKKFNPYTIFLAEWIAFIVVGLVVYNSVIDSYSGLIYILVSCFVYLCAYRLVTSKNNYTLFHRVDLIKVNKLIYISLLIDVVRIFYSIHLYGYSIGSISMILEVSSTARTADVDGNWIIKLSNYFALSVMAVDGYATSYALFNGIKRKSRILLLIIGIGIPAMLSTGKSIVIWALFWWISGWLTGAEKYTISDLQIWNFVKKRWKKILVAFILFLSIMIIMMYMRRQRNFNSLVDSLIIYALGQIPVFSEWFATVSKEELQHSMGMQMLYGIFSKTPLKDNLLDNYPLLMGMLKKGVRTNIYTAFRSLIEDFGKVGGILYWVIFGIFSGINFNSVKRKNNILPICIEISIYYFLLMSFIISAYHYFTPFAVMPILWIEFAMVNKG